MKAWVRAFIDARLAGQDVTVAAAPHPQTRRAYRLRPEDVCFNGRVEKLADGCWLWSGGMHWQYAGQRHDPRLYAWRKAGLAEPGPGLVLKPNCGEVTCIRPEHQRLMAKHEVQQEAARQHPTKGTTRLTTEQVAAIRADTRPGWKVARKYGISRSYAIMIRRGQRLAA